MANFSVLALTILTLYLSTCSAQYEEFGLVSLGTVRAEKGLGRAEIFISYKQVTWEEAQDYCDASGHKIVGIQSARKDSDLRKLLLENGKETFWTSGNDRDENNKYFWNDNMTPINWRPWNTNANLVPRDIGRSCMLFQSTTGAPPSVTTKPWDEEYCGNYHYVCCEL